MLYAIAMGQITSGSILLTLRYACMRMHPTDALPYDIPCQSTGRSTDASVGCMRMHGYRNVSNATALWARPSW